MVLFQSVEYTEVGTDTENTAFDYVCNIIQVNNGNRLGGVWHNSLLYKASVSRSQVSSAKSITAWEFGVPVMENFIPASMVWDAITTKHEW